MERRHQGMEGGAAVSDHLIAEANRHAKALSKMTLPTTKPNARDLDWYVRECESLDERNKMLEAENAERGLRLVTIEEIIDDSHRSDKAKVLALKWMLGRKEAQP